MLYTGSLFCVANMEWAFHAHITWVLEMAKPRRYSVPSWYRLGDKHFLAYNQSYSCQLLGARFSNFVYILSFPPPENCQQDYCQHADEETSLGPASSVRWCLPRTCLSYLSAAHPSEDRDSLWRQETLGFRLCCCWKQIGEVMQLWLSLIRSLFLDPRAYKAKDPSPCPPSPIS